MHSLARSFTHSHSQQPLQQAAEINNNGIGSEFEAGFVEPATREDCTSAS